MWKDELKCDKTTISECAMMPFCNNNKMKNEERKII